MPDQLENNDIKITRISPENKIYFQSLMSAEMYFAVELENHFTLAAYLEQPDADLSPESGIETIGVLQFATDGTRGKYAQAKILAFSVADGERGDEAWNVLLSELLGICRKAGILTVKAESAPEEEAYLGRLRESGFSFTTIRKIKADFSLATLNQQGKAIFTSKIPESYARLEILDLDQLSPRQHKALVRHFSETEEWDVRNLLHNLKKPDRLKSYIAVRENEPLGAIIAGCEKDGDSDMVVVSIRYMRTFGNDANCLLLLCKTAIADLVKAYGKHIFFSAETAFPPGVKLIQKIQPEIHTFSVEIGTLKVSK